MEKGTRKMYEPFLPFVRFPSSQLTHRVALSVPLHCVYRLDCRLQTCFSG